MGFDTTTSPSSDHSCGRRKCHLSQSSLAIWGYDDDTISKYHLVRSYNIKFYIWIISYPPEHQFHQKHIAIDSNAHHTHSHHIVSLAINQIMVTPAQVCKSDASSYIWALKGIQRTTGALHCKYQQGSSSRKTFNSASPTCTICWFSFY